MGKSVQTIHNVMTHACKALFLAGDCQPVSDNRNGMTIKDPQHPIVLNWLTSRMQILLTRGQWQHAHALIGPEWRWHSFASMPLSEHSAFDIGQ